MLDFNKWNISYLKENELLENPLINWMQNIFLETGELKYPIIGKYYNLIFKINPTRKEISGSLHKLFNELKFNQNQNYNDFTYNDLKQVIFHLKDVFGLNLEKTIIENLEIGLNINTSKMPASILDENLIVWKNIQKSKNIDYDGKGKYIQFDQTQFYFKIYDKGNQYEQDKNILRLECKIVRNELLNKFRISNVSDLLNKDCIKALLNFLYESISECIIVDNLTPGTIIEPNEKEIFTNGINPMMWNNFKNRTEKKRFKDKFISIIEKYDLQTIKKEIVNKSIAKGESLFCYDLNDLQQPERIISNTDLLRNELYIYVQSVTPKKCIITGIDISHQKGESKFLSAKSIENISESDPETFLKLLRLFSPRNAKEMTFKKLCQEVAHNIRNSDSNARQKFMKNSIYFENSMFPIEEIKGNIHIQTSKIKELFFNP